MFRSRLGGGDFNEFACFKQRLPLFLGEPRRHSVSAIGDELQKPGCAQAGEGLADGNQADGPLFGERIDVDLGVRLKLAKAPKMNGATRVGSKVVCTAGSWTHTGHLGVKTQWLRDLKVIKGATRNRYVPVAADRGRQLACKVTVTATGPAGLST